MRIVVNSVLALSLGLLAWSAATAEQAPPQTSTAKTSTAKSVKPGKAPAKTSSAARKGKAAAKSRTTWRNRQMVPAPERYREIEAALAAKGYLNSESIDGTWDQGSIDALKRFQADQHIESSGKINSLSLIALGLGPKHELTKAGQNATSQQ